MAVPAGNGVAVGGTGVGIAVLVGDGGNIIVGVRTGGAVRAARGMIVIPAIAGSGENPSGTSGFTVGVIVGVGVSGWSCAVAAWVVAVCANTRRL